MNRLHLLPQHFNTGSFPLLALGQKVLLYYICSNGVEHRERHVFSLRVGLLTAYVEKGRNVDNLHIGEMGVYGLKFLVIRLLFRQVVHSLDRHSTIDRLVELEIRVFV